MAQKLTEKRLASLEADVQLLKQQLDSAQAVAGIERGIRAMNRKDGLPAREALEAMRKKYKIRST